ncbi:hypothetical protein HPB50_011139 [Hyalomma asiaticum]|uniref:Uncharacterized protein n=1 Tax=Hyalomma asiaticum TaxID=266040 RepID=A0ACB7T217_HYAAI|nr:hypothetical protein HPB50_011139 [Hyalomma asiaticum]
MHDAQTIVYDTEPVTGYGPTGLGAVRSRLIKIVRTDAAARKGPIPRSNTRGITGEGGNNSEEADVSSGSSTFGSGEEKTFFLAESSSPTLRSLGSSRSRGHAPRTPGGDHVRRRKPPRRK